MEKSLKEKEKKTWSKTFGKRQNDNYEKKLCEYMIFVNIHEKMD